MSSIAEVSVEQDDTQPDESTSVQGGEEVSYGMRKVGKPKHPIWSDAFDEPDAHCIHKPNNSTCKHCKQSVRHHHKIICVERHLRKCTQFKKVMLDRAISDRPVWWKNAIQTASHKSTTNGMPNAKLQQSIKSFSIPHFNAIEQKKFNHEMAMYFYCTGTSFVRVEDPHLHRAIQLARPNAKLPTRKQLADDNKGGLLEECYQKVKTDVKKQLSISNQFICITSDAWSSVLNEPIVNYMAVCPTQSLFLEAVHTEEQSHDAEWIAADLVRVMDSLGDNVIGAITDNTATNKKAWKALEENYPHRFFHGCVSHGLNLLVKDIFSAKKPSGEYPDGYPFEDLLLFTINCKEVVSFYHNHHVQRASLRKALKAEKLNNLVQPAPTRWGTILGCFRSLRAADNILNGLVSQRDFVSKGNAKQREKHTEIKEIITDPHFVSNLDECIRILEPIDMFIKIFQSDAAPCSEVYKAFLHLEDKMHSIPMLDEDKKTYLVELVRKRFEFMYGDAHGVAYVLDPRYLGDQMSRSLRKEIEDFIFNFPKVDGSTSKERKDQLAKEYTLFRIDALNEREEKTYRFKMIGDTQSVLQWWKADGTDWPMLRKLAIRVFSMAASAAASERNFSTFGFVHSKLRNRLAPEKVKKLVYIKTNAIQMEGASSYADNISDDDDELMEVDLQD